MFALGETDLCAASECEFEKGIVCKKLIRRGFRFTPHGVENANKKSRPRRVRMTRVGAAHQNRIQHKSSCAMRQRNMRNRQKNGVDEQRAEANIFNRNRHNEIHSFQQKNKVGTPMKQRFGLHTHVCGQKRSFPVFRCHFTPEGPTCQQKNEHSEALSCVQLHFNTLQGILMLHFFVTLKM